MALKRYSKIFLCIVLCISILLCSFTNCFATAGLTIALPTVLIALFGVAGATAIISANATALAQAGATIANNTKDLINNVIAKLSAPSLATVISQYEQNKISNSLYNQAQATFEAATLDTYNSINLSGRSILRFTANNIPSIDYLTIDGVKTAKPEDFANLPWLTTSIPNIVVCPVYYRYSYMLLAYNTLTATMCQYGFNSTWLDSDDIYTMYLYCNNHINTAYNYEDYGKLSLEKSDGTSVSFSPIPTTFNPELISQYLPLVASTTADLLYYDNVINRTRYNDKINTLATSYTGTANPALPGTANPAEDDDDGEIVVIPPISGLFDNSDTATKDLTFEQDITKENTSPESDNPDDGDGERDPISIVGLIDKLLDTLGTIVAFLTAYTMFQALCSILPLPIATLIWAAWLAFILFMLLRLILGR